MKEKDNGSGFGWLAVTVFLLVISVALVAKRLDDLTHRIRPEYLFEEKK